MIKRNRKCVDAWVAYVGFCINRKRDLLSGYTVAYVPLMHSSVSGEAMDQKVPDREDCRI